MGAEDAGRGLRDVTADSKAPPPLTTGRQFTILITIMDGIRLRGIPNRNRAVE